MEGEVKLPEPTFLWDRPEYPHYTADQLRQAVIEERERCAKGCELSPPAIRLMAGEMPAQEMRTVTAVLRGVAAAIRSGEGEMKG